MTEGTYLDWCNDGSSGEFIYTHPDGTERHIQITLEEVATTGDEHEYYRVQWDIPHTGQNITLWCWDEFEVVEHPDKLVKWDTVGQVIDG